MRLRVESVQNAIDQGKAAGAAIAGRELAHTKLPWFWSDQYDLKLQTAGLFHGADTEIIRGSPEAKSFSVYYLKGERIIAVDSVNAPADHMLARKILPAPHAVTAKQLQDRQFDLGGLLA